MEEDGNYFYGYLVLALAFRFIFALEFFLFWLLTSSPVHHQPQERVLCCVGTSALPSPGAVSRREFLKPRGGRIPNDTAPGWCTVTGLAVTVKFLEKCPWAVASSLTVCSVLSGP